MKQKSRFILASAVLLMSFNQKASACNNNPYLGSVCIMAANFCPRGYADAAGQLLAISSNTALFSLLGTMYGGDGRVTFALPDLRGRAPICAGVGAGPGLSNITQGQKGGNETITLTQQQLPAHTHTAQLNGTSTNGDVDGPAGAVPARMPRSRSYSSAVADATMGNSAVTVTGGGSGQTTPVRDPFLGLRYCVATVGVFPSRN